MFALVIAEKCLLHLETKREIIIIKHSTETTISHRNYRNPRSINRSGNGKTDQLLLSFSSPDVYIFVLRERKEGLIFHVFLIFRIVLFSLNKNKKIRMSSATVLLSALMAKKKLLCTTQKMANVI